MTQEIEKSLKIISKICGSEVLSIPLHIGHLEKDKRAPAYTDVNGIYISYEVSTLDPQNFHIYFMHELGHHIFHNSVHTDGFSGRIVNFAEDFKINQWLEETFGYDVTKVRVPGLRNKKYDNLSVEEICAKLKPFSRLRKCGCMGIAHPSIMLIAERMRTKYKINLEANKGHFIVDLMDKRKFRAASQIATNYFPEFEEISSVDMNKALLGLWSQLYLQKAVSYPVGKILTPGEAISYVYNAAPYRENTVNNTGEAMLAAVMFLRKADRDEKRIRYLKDRTINSLRKIINTIESLEHRKKITPKIQERIQSLYAKEAAAEARLKKLDKLQPLHKLLHEHKIRVIKNKSNNVRHPTALVNIWENNQNKLYRQQVLVPSIRTNETSQRIRFLSRISFREYETVKKLSEELGETFNVDLSDEFENFPESSEKESENSKSENNSNKEDSKKSEKSEKESESEKVKEEGQSQKEGQESDSDDEQAQEGSGNSDSVDNSGSNAPENDGGLGNAQVSDEREFEDEKNNAKEPNSGMQGKGNSGEGETAPRNNKLELMLEVAKNIKDLKFLLSKMQEFESKFSHTTTKDVSESNELPSSYGYGNDLENVVASELALLFNKETELEFLTRLANHSLLQHQPPSNKRLPVVLCIDSSGSMGKQRYNTAMAFALALMKILHKEKRGVALMTFTSSVDQFMVVNQNSVFDLLTVIAFLRKARIHGTNFDKPILKALDIKQEQNWRNVQIILVTDGDAVFTRVDEIKNRKSKGDVITGVLAESDSFMAGTQEIIDDIILANRKDQELQLIKLANKIL